MVPPWRIKPELVIVISTGFLVAYAVWITPHILADGLFPRTMDFVSFYTAAQLALAKPEALYDLQAQSALQRPIFRPYTTPGDVLGYFNTPLLAYLIIPFTSVPYDTSFWLFLSFNIFIFLLVSQQLRRLHNGTREHYLAWILAGLAYYPVFKCMVLGQNSIFSLLIWTVAARLLLESREQLSGRILAVQIFKPQLLILVAPFFFIKRKWAATRQFILFSLVLLIASFIPIGLSGTKQFFALVGQITIWNEMNGIFLDGIQSWRGLFYLLLRGRSLSTINSASIMVGGLTAVICMIVWLQQRDAPLTRDALSLELSSLILATLLITPHAYNHDLTILLLPAALLMSNVRSQNASRKLSVLFPILSALFFIITFVQGILPKNAAIPLVQPLLLFSLILLLYELRDIKRGKPAATI